MSRNLITLSLLSTIKMQLSIFCKDLKKVHKLEHLLTFSDIDENKVFLGDVMNLNF